MRFAVARAAIGLTLLVCCPFVTAQALVITGSVQDQAGAAMPDVPVRLSRGAETRTVATRFDGSFGFDKVTPGPYDLVVERDGFKPVTTHVIVGARSPRATRIRLEI